MISVIKRMSLTLLLLAVVSLSEQGRGKHRKISSERLTSLNHGKNANAIAEANNNFSVNLHEKLKPDHPNNLVFSPFSVSTVLAMLKNGARGKTLKEIEKVAGFPVGQAQVNLAYLKTLSSFMAPHKGYLFKAATRVYIQKPYPIQRKFSETLKNIFGAKPQSIDFSKNKEAAKEINEWVEESTKHKINKLISPESLNTDTKLVLVNAVYFKGTWKDQFDAKETRKENFHLDDKKVIEVDMMFRFGSLPILRIDESEVQILALPYKGDRLSMLIFLPNAVSGLSALEKQMDNWVLENLLEDLAENEQRMEIFLPKFKFESTINLENPLGALGLRSMFDAGLADFSGIPEPASKELYVSKAIQKAFIEVNEEGTEAAAATAFQMTLKSLPFRVYINRPFAFQIVDTKSKFVLFAGSVTNPSEN